MYMIFNMAMFGVLKIVVSFNNFRNYAGVQNLKDSASNRFFWYMFDNSMIKHFVLFNIFWFLGGASFILT